MTVLTQAGNVPSAGNLWEGVQVLATIAAILGPIVVYLTYRWSQMDSARDIEQLLRSRLLEVKFVGGPFVVQVTGIRVRETNSWRSKLKRMFLFHNQGHVRVEMFILEQKVAPDNLWDGPLFDVFCEARGIPADFVSSDLSTTDGTGLIFNLQTLNPEDVEEFIKLTPEFLNLLRKEDLLGKSTSGISQQELKSILEDLDWDPS